MEDLIVLCRWIYQTKFLLDGLVDKYKAQLVAKGFSQVIGIDYIKTFAPVGKMTSIQITLVIAIAHGCFVHHMDVKSAFLHGIHEEEI